MVGHGDVVDLHPTGLEHLARRADDRCSPQPSRLLTRRERPWDGASLRSRGVGEVAIAAAHRQSIRLAHRRHADHLDAEVQGAHHVADEHELLVVLFAKQREIRPSHVEEFGHHRKHTGEVSGSTRSLEDAAAGTRFDRDAELRAAVYLRDRRREDDVHTVALADGDVCIECARIAVEVFPSTELRGIDEVRDDDTAVGGQPPACLSHELRVTVMQGTHRHDDSGRNASGCRGIELHPRGGEEGHRSLSDRTPRSASASAELSLPAAWARSTVARARAR